MADIEYRVIERLDPSFFQFIRKEQVHPFRLLPEMDSARFRNCFFSALQQSIECDTSYSLVATDRDKPVGVAVFSELPWDSAYFQRRMGAVSYFFLNAQAEAAEQAADGLLTRGIEAAVHRGWEFLLCKCSTDDVAAIHSLEKKGFLNMDALLDFVYDYQSPRLESLPRPVCPPGFQLRLATEADCEELAGVAGKSFQHHFGRYHADTNLSARQSQGIYEEWLRSACRGWADYVIVAEKEKTIAGFSAWKRPSALEQTHQIALGHYSIGGIHPEFQHQGLFQVLTYEGMRRLQEECRWIEGPTHINNFGVQRGYQKLGWKICGSRYSFHKWL